MSEPREGDPVSKAPRGERPDDCLHCVVMTSVEQWFERHGERRHGNVVIDVAHAINKLTECIVELAYMPPERSKRRRAMCFAHDCLDAGVKSRHTGKLVAVDLSEEH
jgi:hypothetical protein